MLGRSRRQDQCVSVPFRRKPEIDDATLTGPHRKDFGHLVVRQFEIEYVDILREALDFRRARNRDDVLLGGAGVVLGPFIGALVMFYLIDISGNFTTASLGVVGLSLLVLVLFAPRGILGLVRERLLPWLP